MHLFLRKFHLYGLGEEAGLSAELEGGRASRVGVRAPSGSRGTSLPSSSPRTYKNTLSFNIFRSSKQNPVFLQLEFKRTVFYENILYIF